MEESKHLPTVVFGRRFIYILLYFCCLYARVFQENNNFFGLYKSKYLEIKKKKPFWVWSNSIQMGDCECSFESRFEQ